MRRQLCPNQGSSYKYFVIRKHGWGLSGLRRVSSVVGSTQIDEYFLKEHTTRDANVQARPFKVAHLQKWELSDVINKSFGKPIGQVTTEVDPTTDDNVQKAVQFIRDLVTQKKYPELLQALLDIGDKMDVLKPGISVVEMSRILDNLCQYQYRLLLKFESLPQGYNHQMSSIRKKTLTEKKIILEKIETITDMLLSSRLLNEVGAYSALRLIVANHEYKQAYDMLEKIESEISKGFLVWTVDLLNTKLALFTDALPYRWSFGQESNRHLLRDKCLVSFISRSPKKLDSIENITSLLQENDITPTLETHNILLRSIAAMRNPEMLQTYIRSIWGISLNEEHKPVDIRSHFYPDLHTLKAIVESSTLNGEFMMSLDYVNHFLTSYPDMSIGRNMSFWTSLFKCAEIHSQESLVTLADGKIQVNRLFDDLWDLMNSFSRPNFSLYLQRINFLHKQGRINNLKQLLVELHAKAISTKFGFNSEAHRRSIILLTTALNKLSRKMISMGFYEQVLDLVKSFSISTAMEKESLEYVENLQEKYVVSMLRKRKAEVETMKNYNSDDDDGMW
ncbi:Hypothetical protein PP7435_CHR1-0342 [Komagataella phaffii CBS 7435]|uniref:ATPase expression protein 2, mitochondrial n=1 Tax=Komagataella phaffii (strain ATCC 76273 / CBS 7435 / CECT 11047 / NRRL Y-11430 / Wegner 21-1) TaxID=981350 RepID=F2QNR8_KOMPC|nr:GQ67_02605T0 [Komagataella phaffii]AOA66373.1 GQ68_02643T0 [Komagataella phaffii GS115]CAH2446064.1 Hypothetical protein BQ9382_C1-1770 [Komagataella phaffii CBS 7435]CCA36501.1 Hypothetical protein PP7435_CHR1-0342 [Komagataella phaffii CBS 7435]